MTDPVRVGELLPGVVAELVERAGHGYDRWAELVAQAGYCHHPIRLAGRVEHADRTTGDVRTVYDSEGEPDGVLLKACGTRRESRCPSCAATYRADAYQLLAAGLKGGKGVPDSISEHPRLFVTFTAPSFGKVHSRRAQGRLVLPCHPHRQGARCPHGNRDGCWHRHGEDDPRLGEPLCPSCYDSQAQVLWNALAPELWRRTTIAIQRALGRLVGLQEGELRRLVRISYAKVAEFQRRGAIHFHAVIRLDAGTDCRCPACLAPPPAPFTAALLEEALCQAVPVVRVPCPALEDGGPGRYARWGEQGDVRNISRDDQEGSCRRSRWPGTSPSTRPRPPRASGPDWIAASPATTWMTWTGCPSTSVSLSGPVGSWAPVLSWRGSGCGPGRTCWASVATGRPRAAGIRPPSRSYAGPGPPSPGAAGFATAFPWMPGVGPRTTRPSSSSPPGSTSAWVTRRRGSGGWHSRPPRALVNSDGWPGRNYARWRHEQEQ
jgi:hypothetical protein